MILVGSPTEVTGIERLTIRDIHIELPRNLLDLGLGPAFVSVHLMEFLLGLAEVRVAPSIMMLDVGTIDILSLFDVWHLLDFIEALGALAVISLHQLPERQSIVGLHP